MHTHTNTEINNITFTQLLKDKQSQKLKAILLFYIPSTNIYKDFNNLQQLSTSFSFQQPLLGIDYIDLYMKGLLEPSLQTILVLSYHN
jgi:hypothetical protein